MPQALSVPPPTHRLPWQHPNGQVAGPHGPTPTHVLPRHVSPSWVQFWQGMPELPHELWLVPLVQALPWQHPPQVVGPHTGLLTHWPKGPHVSPMARQLVHC